VLDAYQCADINGWRKSQSAIAAFYFTTLADAYATRTGRPDNLGVIGVAFFREMPRPVVWRDRPPKIAENRSDEPGARQEKAAGSVAQDSRAAEAPAPARDQLERSPAAAAPLAKMGTGWGRQESSYVQTTRFERESASPNETLAINYDRRENLVAMGILPPQAIARSADPFPAWTPRFAPEPPR